MSHNLSFCWLGVNGVELTSNDQVLVLDPFLTRPAFWQLCFRRLQPNRTLIKEKIPRCDAILVSHSHYDHLMDVPEVIQNTGAVGYGSPNACHLTAVMGVPGMHFHPISNGDRLSLGELTVDVLPGRHTPTPLDPIINAPLPSLLQPPLRALDYRMDMCFSFLIRTPSSLILLGDGQPQANHLSHAVDAWFTLATNPFSHYCKMIEAIHPRFVIPIHWDNFFLPLSQPIRLLSKPGGMSLESFKKRIETLYPETTVLIPQLFMTQNIK